MELHDQIKAAVEARMELARAAGRDPLGGKAWTVTVDQDRQFVLTDDIGWTAASGYMAPPLAPFIAANDPATILRHCERDLRVLERHAAGAGDPPRCKGCSHANLSAWECWSGWPCSEIKDLAAAYGIEVTE